MAALLRHISKSQKHSLLCKVNCSFNSSSSSLQGTLFSASLQARLVGTVTEAGPGFDNLVAGNQRKFYMLGGKGGVGKTSCAASLAVKFANYGHPTVVISTDPAHSLSDSFAQDLTGGRLVPVEGVASPLYALEINPEKAMEDVHTAIQKGGTNGVKNLMHSMGLGMIVEQLGELKLEELLYSPPPGIDEILAISTALQFVESQEYKKFTRVVLDTAPTGHTLRLLSLPDFMDGSISKLMKLKTKLASSLKSLFGKEEPQSDAADKLEQIKERMAKVRDLFHNSDTTEFIIVTIPTVMAIKESARLHTSLKNEGVPVRRLIINQVLQPASDCKFCAMRRKDQMRAIETIRNDSELASLRLCEVPLVDMEIRGVPALKFMGDMLRI